MHYSQNSRHRVFEFIKGYIASNKQAPTMAEIGRQCGFSSSASVSQILTKLEGQGLIKRTPNISRGIEIVPQAVAPKVGWLDR